MGTLDLAAIRKRCEAATPGPWEACQKGKCPCRQVWSVPADYPVARIEHGEWGDEYPSLRMIGTSLEGKYEAYIDKIEYGDISEEAAEANVAFITAARTDVPTLCDEIERLHRLLSDLTIGGSEFAHDPDRCAEWVQQELDMSLEAAVKAHAEANDQAVQIHELMKLAYRIGLTDIDFLPKEDKLDATH